MGEVTNEPKISIVLADNHPILLQGLRTVLDMEKDLVVIGDAGNGLETVKLVRDLIPDILVMDLIMPVLNGLEAAFQINKLSIKTNIVIFSMYDDDEYVLQAMRNGALGYVLKDSSIDELLEAVRQAAVGERYLSLPLSERLVNLYIENIDTITQNPYELLTGREREVLQMVAEGRSNAEMANVLSISRRTIETHRANMMRKLGLKNKTDIIHYAVKHRILPID